MRSRAFVKTGKYKAFSCPKANRRGITLQKEESICKILIGVSKEKKPFGIIFIPMKVLLTYRMEEA